MTREEAEGTLEFTVTNKDTQEATTHKLSDFIYDGDSGKYRLELTKSAGGYTVVESVKDIDGYELKSVSYMIGDKKSEQEQADVTVEEGETTTVEYEDCYQKKPGKLQITKTILGDVTKEEAAGALIFTVINRTTKESQTYPLGAFTYDPVKKIYTKELEYAAGGYTVEETVSTIAGYTLKSVGYTIGGMKQTGTLADVTVESGKTTRIDYEDNYEAKPGKLVITKMILGEVTRQEAEGALEFTVTDNATQETKQYKLAEFIYDATAQKYTLELEKAAGSYTIVESVKDITGYTLKSVSYTVDGVIGDTETSVVTVKRDETVEVDYKDVYEKEVDIPTPEPEKTPTPKPEMTPTPVPEKTPTPEPEMTPTPMPKDTPNGDTTGTPFPQTPSPTPSKTHKKQTSQKTSIDRNNGDGTGGTDSEQITTEKSKKTGRKYILNNNVRTGDGYKPVFWIILLAASIAMIGCGFGIKRKAKEDSCEK